MQYVIGDVHGCYSELLRLLNKIESQDKNAKFYFVGDFVDRGPEVVETINWVLENITPNGKYRTVLGNHEDMIIDWYEKVFKQWCKLKKSHPESARELVPMTDYDFSDICEKMNWKTEKDLKKIIEKFKSFPTSIDTNIINKNGEEVKFQIVHAAYAPPTANSFWKKQQNIWDRNYYGYDSDEYIIIHGHTPTISDHCIDTNIAYIRPGFIDYRKNDINVDGGCVYGDSWYKCPTMLCAICLETMEEFYSYTLEEKFKLNCPKHLDPQDLIDKYNNTYIVMENPHQLAMKDKVLGKKGGRK